MSERSVLEEVRALGRADLEDLREIWRNRIGAAPKLRSPDLLRRILAWRIQAQVYGSLSGETRRLLRKDGARAAANPSLRPGVRLVREWRGRTYEVEVIDGGFIYDGVRFKSLSQIATLIAGVRWNGPRFFGLRSETVGS